MRAAARVIDQSLYREPPMSRTVFILLVCSAFIPGAAHAADAPRRNVVLLVADDLGRDCGCYGNTLGSSQL